MTEAVMSRKVLRFFLLLIVPLSLSWLALDQYAKGGRYIETDNAYVKAHIVSVSAEMGGRVEKVLVKDQQQVRQGDLLFVLDRAPFQIAFANGSLMGRAGQPAAVSFTSDRHRISRGSDA